MNQVVLNVMPEPSGLPAGGAAKDAPAATAQGAAFFRATLADRLRAAGPSIVRSAASTAEVPEPQRALAAKIAKMIQAGASQADIIGMLAARLTASVAGQLDSPGADARGQLQTLFATALAPPGDAQGPKVSIAERARSLAQRYIRIESLATAIAGDPPSQPNRTGQQNRIAGKLLDAQRAKDIPAPTTTTPAPTPAGIAAVVGVPQIEAVSPALRGAAASPVPSAVSPAPSLPPIVSVMTAQPQFVFQKTSEAGDGRTVKLGSKTAIAAGGDTTLGRILTRAALAADARATPASPDLESIPAAASPVAAATPDTALASFVKSFEAALNAGSDSGTAPTVQHDVPPAALPPLLHETVSAPAGFVLPVALLPIAHAATVVAVAAPAVPAPVDPNAIADQVLRGAFMRNTGESSEMRLSLVPETLGDVSVKLVVNAGVVTAHVVAETPEVRDALIAAQPQLTKSLADAGLKLQSFTVDLSGGSFGGFAQQQNDRSQNEDRSRRSASFDDPGGIDELPLEAIPSFGPSIAATPNAGDFNHLA